ncbi:MAG: hypothetical protein ACP5Q4_07215 [Candidatus Caldatribacteriaceae bacterium]
MKADNEVTIVRERIDEGALVPAVNVRSILVLFQKLQKVCAIMKTWI